MQHSIKWLSNWYIHTYIYIYIYIYIYMYVYMYMYMYMYMYVKHQLALVKAPIFPTNFDLATSPEGYYLFSIWLFVQVIIFDVKLFNNLGSNVTTGYYVVV